MAALATPPTLRDLMTASAAKMRTIAVTKNKSINTNTVIIKSPFADDDTLLYIWVTAKLDAGHDIFCKEELREHNATAILTETLKIHAPMLEVSEAVVAHDIITTTKTTKQPSKGKKGHTTVKRQSKERRVALKVVMPAADSAKDPQERSDLLTMG
eukprot:10997578-Ditylum_brightwellii.AAC.1